MNDGTVTRSWLWIVQLFYSWLSDASSVIVISGRRGNQVSTCEGDPRHARGGHRQPSGVAGLVLFRYSFILFTFLHPRPLLYFIISDCFVLFYVIICFSMSASSSLLPLFNSSDRHINQLYA